MPVFRDSRTNGHNGCNINQPSSTYLTYLNVLLLLQYFADGFYVQGEPNPQRPQNGVPEKGPQWFEAKEK